MLALCMGQMFLMVKTVNSKYHVVKCCKYRKVLCLAKTSVQDMDLQCLCTRKRVDPTWGGVI